MGCKRKHRAFGGTLFSRRAGVRIAGFLVAGLLGFSLASMVIASVANRAAHIDEYFLYDPDLSVIWNTNQRLGYARAYVATPDGSPIFLQPDAHRTDAEDAGRPDYGAGAVYLGRERAHTSSGYVGSTIGRLSDHPEVLGGHLDCFVMRGEEPRLIYKYDIGFPLRAVSFARASPAVPSPYVNHLPGAPLLCHSVGGRVLGFEIVIPFRIDWPCFVVDVVAWGAALGAIWFGVGAVSRAVRGALRSRRSRCARCGYDLAGFSGSCCPECGGRFARKSELRQ